MSSQIKTTNFIRIPLTMYLEIKEFLYLNQKINAIKVLRNRADDDIFGAEFRLKECKCVVDWIWANPGAVFTNDRYALVPASILE